MNSKIYQKALKLISESKKLEIKQNKLCKQYVKLLGSKFEDSFWDIQYSTIPARRELKTWINHIEQQTTSKGKRSL